MARYIDAENLNGYAFGLISPYAQNLFHKIINEAPTENVKPIIYAEWEILGEKDNLKRCRCSNCKEYQCNTPKFCSGCGAEMKGIKYV